MVITTRQLEVLRALRHAPPSEFCERVGAAGYFQPKDVGFRVSEVLRQLEAKGFVERDPVRVCNPFWRITENGVALADSAIAIARHRQR
jgi:DNA-binding MarR family transcriptional regulator